MAKLTINGRDVTVDDSFHNLPEEEQHKTIDEIAASMSPGAGMPSTQEIQNSIQLPAGLMGAAGAGVGVVGAGIGKGRQLVNAIQNIGQPPSNTPNVPAPASPSEVARRAAERLAPNSPYINASSPYELPGASNVKNWAGGKGTAANMTGQDLRGFLGGGTMAEEALLQRHADEMERMNYPQKVVPGSHYYDAQGNPKMLMMAPDEVDRIKAERQAKHEAWQTQNEASHQNWVRQNVDPETNRLARARAQRLMTVKNEGINDPFFRSAAKIGKSLPFALGTGAYNATDLANQLESGNTTQAAISGAGLAASAVPKMNFLPRKLKAAAPFIAVGAPLVNRNIDLFQGRADGGHIDGYAAGGGLYENIHAKQERIAHGSGEHMRRPGSPGAPTAHAFEESAKTAHVDGYAGGRKVVEQMIGRESPGLVSFAKKFGYDPNKIGLNYPDIAKPVLTVDPKTGKEFFQKQLSPEALAVQKARKAAQSEINAGNYTPHFNIADRFYADPSRYKLTGDTITDVVPKKAETVEKYEALANAPESLARLRGAFEKAKDRPLAKDWYAMGQLEKAFIDELGPEEGARQFKNRFADAMAATTGGADPNSNLMMAAYTNFQKQAGKPIPTTASELPFPIGGRFVSGNMEQANKVAEQGGISHVSNPKRYNFSANFLGNRDRSTLDEQMSQLWDPKMMAPPGNAYGIYEKALANLAKEYNVQPANFQDIAWAGAKDYPGKPMMQEINEMLARTSKITGQPQEEVLKGFIRGDRPMYSITGLGALGGAGSQMVPESDSNPEGYAGGGDVVKKAAQEFANTVKAYKLFRTNPNRPDELFPLFVNANESVRPGEWLEARAGEMVGDKVKSKLGPLAYRPGWHAGDLPIATHIGGKSEPGLKAPDYRPGNQVWAEVEMPADVDWQKVAMERAQRNKAGDIIPRTAHITDQVPLGGHYRYKTNPNMTGEWLIGGNMKVNRVLSDDEVKAINDAAGVADLPRIEGRAMGGLIDAFAGGGHTTPAWQRSEGKNPEGGLNAAGRASYNRETGGHLKAPQPEGGSRRDSFCARMEGMKKKLTSSETANDPDSRINKSLRKWKC